MGTVIINAKHRVVMLMDDGSILVHKKHDGAYQSGTRVEYTGEALATAHCQGADCVWHPMRFPPGSKVKDVTSDMPWIGEP